MTGNVDFDRLADYVGGALDGTSDADAVARLVATDPQWTWAHTDLVAAEALVRADLAALADGPEPMPEQVMARLAAAFDAEPPLAEPPPAEAPLTEPPPAEAPLTEPPLAGSAPEKSHRHLSAVPGGRVDPAPAGRRWRALVGVAAAAALLGLGAISLTQVLRHGSTSSMSTASGTGSQSRVAGPADAGTASGYAAADVRASGLDYDPGTLTALGGASTQPHATTVPAPEPRPNVLEAPPQPSGHPTGIPDPLQRLTAPDARAACLNAIQARYGGTATLLDYARFEGSPALIVVLDGAGGAAGRKWVVAVGPSCGSGGVIADQRYSGPVG